MKSAYLLAAFSLLFSVLMVAGCSNNEDKNKEEEQTEKSYNKIKGVVSYRKEFNDLNDVHLSSAKRLGISPIHSREDLERTSRELLYIGDNEFYSVDRLTHSVPYLVPRASAVLMAIAINFQDSLAAKGLEKHKLIVTSVLRTKNDVKKLRKRNVNASANSAHSYGTTFDISYNRYLKTNDDGEDDEVRMLKLKLVLSEVLKDMRDAGLCHVKHEIRQGCFHITAR